MPRVLAQGLLYESWSSVTKKIYRVLGSSVVALGVLGPACAMRPPVRNSGATTSPNGVVLAVTGQRCSETVETDWPDTPLVETYVHVEVRNDGPPPLVINRDAFHLRAPDGRQIPTASGPVKDTVSVDPGQTRTFELRFMSRGGLSCTRPMQLEASGAVTKGDGPVQLGSITFVPSHA